MSIMGDQLCGASAFSQQLLQQGETRVRNDIIPFSEGLVFEDTQRQEIGEGFTNKFYEVVFNESPHPALRVQKLVLGEIHAH